MSKRNVEKETKSQQTNDALADLKDGKKVEISGGRISSPRNEKDRPIINNTRRTTLDRLTETYGKILDDLKADGIVTEDNLGKCLDLSIIHNKSWGNNDVSIQYRVYAP